jgi:hypothetical protein
MAGVITASEPSWIAPFAGLSPRGFGKLMTVVRREVSDEPRRGRPWGLPLEDRVLLVVAYWRTNLTMRQLASLFGVSKSAADRIIDHLGPKLALRPRQWFAKDAVLIVDGTLVPTRDHAVAEQSKNYRYSTNHQVVIDADTRLVVVVGRPLPGNRNDCTAWEESGAKDAPVTQPCTRPVKAATLLYSMGSTLPVRLIRGGRPSTRGGPVAWWQRPCRSPCRSPRSTRASISPLHCR